MNRTPDIDWRFVPFSVLTTLELYEMLQLRSEVFVVEQSCPFQDMDGADQKAMHLMGVDKAKGGRLVAYARCFAAGEKFAEASIGRVVTHMSARGDGIGHVLIKEAIARLLEHWGPQPIRIGAQARLEKFYRQHGFVQNGEPYIEDGIPHIEMLRVA
ncbi:MULTISPECIES: GNAT family N-acetyltransferase [unclassified Polaromonas]|uniref:GNAT family N-acetyltransferase n=1 Tax=unclassified Polaromonas TaxID=2638319 RepID=UPI000F080C39|nr:MULTISPECIES: GNAT family N-acetyltransferase [unclassified Polaromonas]AYQ29563.1 GNAT family N-acetyltransferase [Polaromonas sp. SP1]QGJ19321.1 GNAT family N-acetyltransferase [Polaromonas sp. Pch-P]